MFSYSVETKVEPLFQSNMPLESTFEVKIPLFWFSLAASRIKCLSAVKKFKENTTMYIIQTLFLYSILCGLFFYTPFIYDCVYSFRFYHPLKDFVLFLKLFLSINVYTSFPLSPKPIYVFLTHCNPCRGLFLSESLFTPYM